MTEPGPAEAVPEPRRHPERVPWAAVLRRAAPVALWTLLAMIALFCGILLLTFEDPA